MHYDMGQARNTEEEPRQSQLLRGETDTRQNLELLVVSEMAMDKSLCWRGLAR